MAAESELANQYGTKVMDIGKQTAEVLNESGEEIASWLEKTTESFAETTTKPAAKKTASSTSTAKKAA